MLIHETNIEGPFLISSASPTTLIKILVSNKIHIKVAETGGITKLRTVNQRDFKLIWNTAIKLLSR